MLVDNKMISHILLLVGLVGSLTGCGSGANNQNIANNAMNDLTLQSYIKSLNYKPLSTNTNINISSKNTLAMSKLGNQQVFTALAPVTLASIEMNYYTDDHCESLSSVTTIGGSATTIPAGTYSTSDQSNYNLCNAYAGGCSAELSAAQNSTFKSIQYKYNYTNLASSSSTCMYNSDKGYEALADYSTPATPTTCASGSSCGYSEPYGAQLLGIPAISTNSGSSCRVTGSLSNNLTCWGSGSGGQMGNGQGVDALPSQVVMPDGIASFSQVSVDTTLSCGIANTGNIYCWGAGGSGQIGNGANDSVNVPTQVIMPSGITSFNMVSTNASFSCAIANNGNLYCWGGAGSGQIGNGDNAGVNVPTAVTMPSGVESFTTVSTNTQFSCAIANNGKVYCWGTGNHSQIGNGANTNVNTPTSVVMPSGVESFTAISTSGDFSCGIANTGSLYCWGYGPQGQLGTGNVTSANVPTSVTMPNGVESFTAISTNANFSCAIANTGTIYCWGAGPNGQIGNSNNGQVNVPTAVTMPNGVTSFTAVSTNLNFSCALANTGQVYCWGKGGSGQIGNGTYTTNVNLPTLVTMPNGVTSFTSISTNSNFSCALANNNNLYCWGNGGAGQIGNGIEQDINVPTAITVPHDVSSFNLLATNSNFSCAGADNGKLYCWGNGGNGFYLGRGAQIYNTSTNLVFPPGVNSFNQVVTNGNFSCALANNGQIYCWGLILNSDNGFVGSIGNSTDSSANLPTPVTVPNGVTSFSQLSTNSNFSCALAINGNAYCWGYGFNGQIGNGDNANVNMPTPVALPIGVNSFSTLSTNANFACAIANTGIVYCWGDGSSNGQIGSGANVSVNVPTAVVMPSGVTSFTAISTNSNFSCALANTGAAYCWGSGGSGQIGNGDNLDVNVPTLVTMPNGVTSFSSISTNGSSSCALANTGKIYCWGEGGSGQVGNGDIISVNVPTPITMPNGVTSFSSVSTNGYFSCALANNGNVYCWGYGSDGQIGNGENNDVNVPTAVTMPSGVTSFGYISTNASFSCAIAASGDNAGSTYCWGIGASGQIGNGANNNINVPTLVQ